MSHLTARGTPRQRWRPGFLAIVVLTSMMTASDPTFAQSGGTVRGKISWCAGNYPAAYLRVTLLPPDRARSSLSFTDRDGFYYFYNIPGGDYFLQISRGGNSSPVTYRIRVFNQPYTDISPICLK